MPALYLEQQYLQSFLNQSLPPKLRLRLKINFTPEGGAPVTEQVDWSEPA